MQWEPSLWWCFGLLSTWFVVFLVSGRRRFATYYPGGIWSVVFASLIEFMIRRNLGFWNLERLFTSFLLVELVTFIGPRFTEGLLFYQYLPKQTSLQLPMVVFAGLSALLTDLYVTWAGFATVTLHTAAISLLVHLLRFLALLALWYGFSFERRAERLGEISSQELQHRIGKTLWKLSWIPIYFGVRMVVGRMEKQQERS